MPTPTDDYENVTYNPPRQQTAPDHVGWKLWKAACAVGRWLRNQWRAQANAETQTKKGRFLRRNLDALNEQNQELKDQLATANKRIAELEKQLKPPPETEAEWAAEHSHLVTAQCATCGKRREEHGMYAAAITVAGVTHFGQCAPKIGPIEIEQPTHLRAAAAAKAKVAVPVITGWWDGRESPRIPADATAAEIADKPEARFPYLAERPMPDGEALIASCEAGRKADGTAPLTNNDIARLIGKPKEAPHGD